jgi:hypothetical protein
MKRYTLIAILLCWYCVAMATISVHLNPPAVQLGESFRLTFTIDDPKSSGIPNLTPLQENFTIAGTERSMLYSIINGQTHAVNQWTVLLTPKKTGMLPIPPIQIGSQQSTATSINVAGDTITTTLNDLKTTSQDEVMLKTEANLPELFINQQLIYTVKLYNSQRLLEAEYKPPTVEDALMVPLGDGRRYQTTINGRGYSVEEQQYAIFPQKSGQLKIIAPTFNALVFDAVPRRLNVQAKTTQLMVKPIPANYKGKDWLPASQVALTEVYDQTKTSMKQGDTLVRTVTLQAVGVPAQLLPLFTVDSGPQFNAYSEKPELHNTARQQELIGRVDVKVTYLLNKAGSITIPAFNLPWFNTVTGKEEVVSLPARTLDIKASNGGIAQQTNTPPQSNLQKTPDSPSTADLPSLRPKKSNALAWWLASAFTLTFILVLTFWWLRKSTPVNAGSKQLVIKNLRLACSTNNPNHAQQALLDWATFQWPNEEVLNLHHIAKLIHDAALKKQLMLLSKTLYDPEEASQWRGDALWRSIQSYTQKKFTTKNRRNELPPINPN